MLAPSRALEFLQPVDLPLLSSCLARVVLLHKVQACLQVAATVWLSSSLCGTCAGALWKPDPGRDSAHDALLHCRTGHCNCERLQVH